MGVSIEGMWEGLKDAGLPEVMLYLADGTASRCHWDDTTRLGGNRVALLADQERNIVRIIPVESCASIGIASPKGIDSAGYRAVVLGKLTTADAASSNPDGVVVEGSAR